MFGNNRKTIGVLISQVSEEYQDGVCRGIITRANELDYNVAFFTNFGGFGQLSYDKGEVHMADLPDYEALDGIIITPDIMVLEDLREKYLSNILSRSHCPVVSVRREKKGFYNVLIDDDNVLDEIINHFIDIHGFTRINFLSGPRDVPDTNKRLENYKRVLRQHNIPVEEERIIYGDLWKNDGILAVDQWLNSDLEWPQAIICANDYMALTVCRALIDRGISVPDQIAVSGCDDIEDAAEYSPSLTTAKMPSFEMGIEAVEKIHKHNTGVQQNQNSYMQTVTTYRDSCGCKTNWYHESNTRRCNHILARESLQSEIAQNSYMSTDLAGLTKLEDIVEKLWIYINNNFNLTHFCMCLNQNWDQYKPQDSEEHGFDFDEMIMEMGIKNQERFTKLKFSKKNLIPEELSEDRPMNYFFAILHHQDHCFGYVGISFGKIQTYMTTFQAWLVNVSNTLENIRIHAEVNRLVYKLEDMSIRDELTGLYNRRVLETLGKQYLSQCLEGQSKLMVFTADMDRLKYINDNFGHFYGDIALKVVAIALQKAADDDEICIRLGGDEFMVIGMDYDDIKMCKFIRHFVEELNRFNVMQHHDVNVYASYGFHLVIPDPNTTIESCMKLADGRMYKQKHEKVAKNIKANIISE